MPHDSSSPYNPRTRPKNATDPLQSVEVHPTTGTHGNVPWQNGYQPGVNYDGPHHGRNDANYGEAADWAQYRDNLWNEGPAPPSENLGGQQAYQGNPTVGYSPPGNAQHYFAPPGPPPVGYYVPPAHGVPNSGYAPPADMPYVADPFSQNVPNFDPSRTSAMEDLKRLANRYLHNPDSRVNSLRMGLSPSGSRFRVMILLEVDDIV